MEKDISNWRNLWKEEIAAPLDLNKIEKKGKLERLFLLISVLITLVLLVILLPILSSIYYLLSVALIGLGMIMIVIQFYRTKYRLINNSADLNNCKYVETLIDKLKQRMCVTSKYMWVYTFFLISGLNIGYIAVLQSAGISMLGRVIIHVAITGIMFWIMSVSIRKRKKKNDNEILPLIEILEDMQ